MKPTNLFYFFFVPKKKRSTFAHNNVKMKACMKEKLELEYELRSKSAKLIWTLISTDTGLKKWLADDVCTNGRRTTFTWGNPGHLSETHTARVLEVVKKDRIRWYWEYEDDKQTYWEIKMSKDEIAENYHLHITDFATSDELEDLTDIWNNNIDRLRLSTGM